MRRASTLTIALSISVALLLECLAAGMTIPEIVDTYPSRTEQAVKGAIEELAREKENAAA